MEQIIWVQEVLVWGNFGSFCHFRPAREIKGGPKVVLNGFN